MVFLTTPPAFLYQEPCYLILYIVILDMIDDAEEAFVDRTKHGLASAGIRNCVHAMTAVGHVGALKHLVIGKMMLLFPWAKWSFSLAENHLYCFVEVMRTFGGFLFSQHG